MVKEEDVSSSNKRSGSGAAAVVTVDAKQLRIDEETHKILTSLGQFGETYGDIVKRIAKHYASCPEVRKEKQDSKGSSSK